ncbi:MAG: HEAT repeat domain-containing protein [Elusimicrobia bacterium]|nr:HEAT repeat domain-containing protein [Candidatus Liberimonas magnetica]
MLRIFLVSLFFAGSSLLFAEDMKTPAPSSTKNVSFDVFVSTNIKKIKGLEKETRKKLLDKDASIRRNTVLGLAVKGKTGYLPALFAMLYDQDIAVQRASVMAITSIGEEKAAKYLIDKFNMTGELNIQNAIITALGELKSTASLPFLGALLKDSYPGFRHESLKSIAMINDPGTYPLIAEMINDESEGIKITAANLSAELNIPDSIPLLLKNLDHSVSIVRTACANALGKLGNEDSIEGLKKLLKDKDEQVKNAAEAAIQSIKERLKAPK